MLSIHKKTLGASYFTNDEHNCKNGCTSHKVGSILIRGKNHKSGRHMNQNCGPCSTYAYGICNGIHKGSVMGDINSIKIIQGETEVSS